MNFKEEYKSAMNKISPDEQTARRIEQAVLQKAAKPSKKKKPFYVYAGAFSGAAACIVGAILLINFNLNNSKNLMINATENYAGASAGAAGSAALDLTASSSSAALDFTTSPSGAEREDKFTADGAQDYSEEPTAPMKEFGDAANAKNEGDLAVTQESSVNPGYTLGFQYDESVVVYNGDTVKKYIPYGTVERYSQEQQDLISAKDLDGKTVFILLKNDYLYVFEDDLKTANVYKLSD